MDAKGEVTIAGLIITNIMVSVGLVAANKILFQTLAFPFVTLLSALHFLSGFGFLTVASSPRFALFKLPDAPPNPYRLWTLAGAGALSIVLNNYSLQVNSLGSAQIFKAAVLPAALVLPLLQGASDQMPSTREGLAALVVMVGSCLSIVADVSTTWVGVVVGALAVLTTAQFQMWSSTFQKLMGLNGTQLLHASSLPQGILTLVASLVIETTFLAKLAGAAGGGGASPASPGTPLKADLFTFHYTSMHVGFALATCILAVLLNWSSFSILGKTNAVTMQVTTQAKTVILIILDFLIFPKPPMGWGKSASFFLGSATCISGAIWYAYVKSQAMAAAKTVIKVNPEGPVEGGEGGGGRGEGGEKTGLLAVEEGKRESTSEPKK